MHAEATVASRPSQRPAPRTTRGIDAATIDARVLALFDNAALRSQLRKLDKVELASVWRLTQHALGRQDRKSVV